MGRLEAIVNLIDNNKVVADIGTDHGITAIKIFEEKNPKRLIATDISKNSLQKLIDKLEYLNYNIETMVTDGIKELPSGFEEIIISGMGGYLISEILEEGINISKAASKLILQANNSIHHLRSWLYDNGFKISKELMVEEDSIIYYIIQANYDPDSIEKPYSDIEYEYGRYNIDNKYPLLIKHLQSKIENLQSIYEKIKEINTEETNKRSKQILIEKEALEDLLWKLEN